MFKVQNKFFSHHAATLAQAGAAHNGDDLGAIKAIGRRFETQYFAHLTAHGGVLEQGPRFFSPHGNGHLHRVRFTAAAYAALPRAVESKELTGLIEPAHRKLRERLNISAEPSPRDAAAICQDFVPIEMPINAFANNEAPLQPKFCTRLWSLARKAHEATQGVLPIVFPTDVTTSVHTVKNALPYVACIHDWFHFFNLQHALICCPYLGNILPRLYDAISTVSFAAADQQHRINLLELTLDGPYGLTAWRGAASYVQFFQEIGLAGRAYRPYRESIVAAVTRDFGGTNNSNDAMLAESLRGMIDELTALDRALDALAILQPHNGSQPSLG